MRTNESQMAGIEQILRSLPGVVDAARLDAAQRLRVVELEARYEDSSVLPVRNLGVSLLAGRDACFALLKDGRFRPPKVPTVYLVEQGVRAGARHSLDVEGTPYTVVGEEVMGGTRPYDEPVVPVDDSFVIFPERRSGPDVPCSFILPPIAFPELERESRRLGIAGILSISPSLASDSFLRESLGFPPSNDLATLLIGFNIVGRPGGT